MEDVRGLFVGALVLRRICIVTAFVCVALLWLLKADIALVVPRSAGEPDCFLLLSVC